MTAAEFSGWPASAGAAPTGRPGLVWSDPRPRRFNPRGGLYRLPDGTIAYRDPPRGDYDPPPGVYSIATLADPRPEFIGPLPEPSGEAVWWARRQRLRIATAVFGGILGASVVALVVGLAQPPPSPPPIDSYPLLEMISGSIGGVALIATIACGVRLTVHEERGPPSRVQVGADGLRLRF